VLVPENFPDADISSGIAETVHFEIFPLRNKVYTGIIYKGKVFRKCFVKANNGILIPRVFIIEIVLEKRKNKKYCAGQNN